MVRSEPFCFFCSILVGLVLVCSYTLVSVNVMFVLLSSLLLDTFSFHSVCFDHHIMICSVPFWFVLFLFGLFCSILVSFVLGWSVLRLFDLLLSILPFLFNCGLFFEIVGREYERKGKKLRGFTVFVCFYFVWFNLIILCSILIFYIPYGWFYILFQFGPCSSLHTIGSSASPVVFCPVIEHKRLRKQNHVCAHIPIWLFHWILLLGSLIA